MKLYVSIFLTFFLMIGCTKTQQQNSNDTADVQAYKDNVSMISSVVQSEGDRAPNFTWTDENGNQVSFSEFTKGKAVLINFWATWCGPCVHEIPDLIELNNEYKTKGAVIIGISADRDSDVLTMVHEFSQEKKMNYPIIIDNGDLESAFGGIRGLPTTFFIDKSGAVKKKMLGLQSKATFAKELDAVL